MKSLSKQALEGIMSEWHDLDGGIHTYYLMPSKPIPNDIPISTTLDDVISTSTTGAVFLLGNHNSHLIIPPFPIESTHDYPGCNLQPLRDQLQRSHKLLVVLIRRGGFSIGIFHGMSLLVSKTSSPFVKARHRKGGSSSGRFARRRDGQTQILLSKACDALTVQFKTDGENLDPHILGGDKQLLVALEKKCTSLQNLKSIQMDRILNVREPRLKVLKSSVKEIYTSQVITF